MEIRYIAVNNDTRAWDEDTRVFETIEAANAYARMIWDHLTDREKKTREVFVVEVKVTDLDDDAIDENGNIDWVLPSSCGLAEGGFDSSKEAL